MEEKNILIFEDEWPTIKGSFDLANQFAFEGKLHFLSKPRSQDVDFASLGEKFDAVFVDITLAKNSVFDGFSIIKKIIDEKLIDLNRVIVLTGNSKVEEKFKEMGIDAKMINIMYKPVAFNELAKQIKKILYDVT